MNASYFKLPQDKQKKLINAGYKAFSQYPYRKSSMSFVADEAGISKSLLFYYFKNKKEYYLYLFDKAIDFLNDEKLKTNYSQTKDLFEMTELEIERRLKLMHHYPCLFRFVAKAYYEPEEEIKAEIETKKIALSQFGKEDILKLIDYERFKNPSDAKILLDILIFLAEGCMRGREDLDDAKIREILPEFRDMMDSLRRHYYK